MTENTAVREPYKIDSRLRAVCRPLLKHLGTDETLLMASYAKLAPEPLGGVLSRRQKSVLLVITNSRMLIASLNLIGTVGKTLRTISWGDVASIHFERDFLLVTDRLSGNERFLIENSGADVRRCVAEAHARGGEQHSGSYEYLCVRCGSELSLEQTQCPTCGSRFLLPSEAAEMAMWYPGGGHFLLGNYVAFAALVAVEAAFILMVLTWIAYAARSGWGTMVVVTVITLSLAVIAATRGAAAISAAKAAREPHGRGSGLLPTPPNLIREVISRLRRRRSQPIASGEQTPLAVRSADISKEPLANPPAVEPRRPLLELLTSRRRQSRKLVPKIFDVDSAEAAAHHGAYAALFCAVSTAALVMVSWYVPALLPGLAIDGTALIDAMLFLFIAWGIAKLSRFAAVCGLLLYVAERWIMFAETGKVASVWWLVVMLAAFANGIRGTFLYHRLLLERKAEGKRQPWAVMGKSVGSG